MVLTAGAGGLPMDEKKLLEDSGLVGYSSRRGNDLSVHAGIDSTGYVRLLWESRQKTTKKLACSDF